MADSFKVQAIEKFAALITAAFGLIAALAWNEAIKEAVALVFTADDGVWGLLVYAVIVTVLAVVASILIAWASVRAKGKEE